LLNPIIPEKSLKVLDALNINTDSRSLAFLDGKNIIGDDIKIKKLDILFKKIT
jgi:methionyl-tRNA synthetase